jgi:hypothetical protein
MWYEKGGKACHKTKLETGIKASQQPRRGEKKCRPPLTRIFAMPSSATHLPRPSASWSTWGLSGPAADRQLRVGTKAIYLEGELPCPSVLPLPGCSALGGAPVLERNIGKHKIQRLRVFNIPQLGAKLDNWMARLENLTVVHFENLSSL